MGFNLTTDDGETIDTNKLFESIDGYMISFKFNKVISTFMEFYNNNKTKIINKESANEIVKMYCSIAPDFKI